MKFFDESGSTLTPSDGEDYVKRVQAFLEKYRNELVSASVVDLTTRDGRLEEAARRGWEVIRGGK